MHVLSPREAHKCAESQKKALPNSYPSKVTQISKFVKSIIGLTATWFAPNAHSHGESCLCFLLAWFFFFFFIRGKRKAPQVTFKYLLISIVDCAFDMQYILQTAPTRLFRWCFWARLRATGVFWQRKTTLKRTGHLLVFGHQKLYFVLAHSWTFLSKHTHTHT